MKKLSVEEINEGLKKVQGWSVASGLIARQFVFANFRESIAFVNQIADIAEDANHHPDIDIRWNKVTLALTTHDAGGITKLDFMIAEKCDEAFDPSRS